MEFNRLSAQIRLEITKFRDQKWVRYCSNLNSFTPSDGKLWKAINSIDSSNKTKHKQVCLNVKRKYIRRLFRKSDDKNFQMVNYLADTLF